jgi:glycosyltransferase involved in cell wall biosynthesis
MSSLALVLIARDEARCIERCLESARPWVDRMFVLDSGSLDGTASLAREAGALVQSFSWIDDFSAARNHALQWADADWSVVLDADEWVVDGGAAIACLRDLQPEFIGQLRIDSSFESNDGAVCMAPSWIARVLPRGARFGGRVHEQVLSTLPRRRLQARIEHDGYRRSQQVAKHGRNERLLRMALHERPDDPYLHYQQGKDLELEDRFEAALPHYERALAAGMHSDPWRHDLALRLLFVLKRGRHWARAVALADAEFARWPASPDTWFALGDLWLDWALAEPSRATELLPLIEACWKRCLELGENLDLEGSVRGRGSYLAARNLAALHMSLGRPIAANQYRQLEVNLRQEATHLR